MHATTEPDALNGCSPRPEGPYGLPVRVAVEVAVTAQAHPIAVVDGPPARGVNDRPARLMVSPELTISARSPRELVEFLDTARAAVAAVAPRSARPVDPDPRLVEAHQILIEDVLDRLGIGHLGVNRELDEISKADVRTALRSLRTVRELLDGHLAEFGPVPPVERVVA